MSKFLLHTFDCIINLISSDRQEMAFPSFLHTGDPLSFLDDYCLISLVAVFLKVILTLLMNMVLSLVVAVVRSSGPKLSQVLTILRPCCQGVIVLGNNVCVCLYVLCLGVYVCLGLLTCVCLTLYFQN